MDIDAKLDRVTSRHEELAAAMASGQPLDQKTFTRMSKEYAELTPVVEKITALRKAQNEMQDLAALMADPVGDPEMRALAEAEFTELKERLPALEHEIKVLLLPRDEADARNAILEVRAGTGGDEAGLFAADLFRMYQRYADLHGWKFEPLSISESDVGGYREASATINGKNVFARLKFESGVHRVQRVPVTEAGGRIHTSAATVAVLPEAEEVDVKLDEKDLRIDVYRSSGPGGQSVNTTDSAVRITHIPSGIVVAIQDEKPHQIILALCFLVWRALPSVHAGAPGAPHPAATRKSQVGTGDRSERIRTYNFPQGRVTDHRVNLTLHKLDRVLEGEALDEIIDALITEDQAARLAMIE